MKSMEQLEKMYEKEVKLSEQHKKNALDIKKQMELQMGKAVMQKINAFNMTGTEYDKLLKLLANGKKSVLEAAELVLGESSEKSKQETQEESMEVMEVEESESRKETA